MSDSPRTHIVLNGEYVALFLVCDHCGTYEESGFDTEAICERHGDHLEDIALTGRITEPGPLYGTTVVLIPVLRSTRD
ncbi:MAG TPA: hypothetical protein VKZ53_08980 [Candidatus Angelobacter sp.]|nr:hypothetical protein [Candidatus Angelobacter sp.]